MTRFRPHVPPLVPLPPAHLSPRRITAETDEILRHIRAGVWTLVALVAALLGLECARGWW